MANATPGIVFKVFGLIFWGRSGPHDTDFGNSKPIARKARQAGYKGKWAANAGDAALAEFGTSDVRRYNIYI